MSIDLLSDIEAKGVFLVKEGDGIRFTAPKGIVDSALIEKVRTHKSELLRLLTIDDDAPYSLLKNAAGKIPATFSMSPLQQAYWVGEKMFFRQHCKAYYHNEYIVQGLSPERLRDALNHIVERHGALRMRIDADGRQSIADCQPVDIKQTDWRDCAQEEAENRLLAYRDTVENTLPALDSGKPFLFSIHHLLRYSVFSFTFRLIAVDAVSFNRILSELTDFYYDRHIPSRDSGLSYYDYIRFLECRRETPLYRRALNYWRRRADTLPPAPPLPFLDNAIRHNHTPDNGCNLAFKRLSGRLPNQTWQRLRDKIQQLGLTVNSVLCCLYADVISRWSQTADFTLNILVSDRPLQVPGMETLVGNCSTTTLLEIHQTGASLEQRARQIREQMYQDIEHACVAGVELIRLLGLQRAAGDRPPMPVVFTSGIDIAGAVSNFTIHHPQWRLNHTHLKTPQVWLDHQVYEDNGEMVYNWDYMPAVFPAGVVQSMFAYYEAYLRELARSEQYWHARAGDFPLPAQHLMPRREFNRRRAPLPTARLETGFVRMAQQWPQSPAIVTAADSISYGDLLAKTVGIVEAIKALPGRFQAGGNQIIAVYAAKGIPQIAAVMASLMAGHTYLPLDTTLPASRVDYILQHSGAACVLADSTGRLKLATQTDATRNTFQGHIIPLESVEPSDAVFTPGQAASTDRAYIIYTSGSTGNPKGVVINHQAAMNTLEDMVRRFGLVPEDRVLGLSALNFDLSVYDIFATFSQGALLVLPEQTQNPEPAVWLRLVEKYRVSVWNSVPALMEISLEFLRDHAPQSLASIRLALLSGDWIPPKLVQQLRRQCPLMRTIALGGATEASIWSNFYRPDSIPRGWPSVPYGTPLSNQSLFVLDRQLRDCPDWVVGDLYIGGEGLADAYLNDPEKTGAGFITHPASGERQYHTGDLARVREGLIEFIGRSDFQVKIRGFRIELGEIEACLTQHPAVENAVALTNGDSGGNLQLIAFYTTKNRAGKDGEAESASIREHLVGRLPHYMVPNLLVSLKDIPLGNNAKIDRKQLLTRLPEQPQSNGRLHAPETAAQTALHDIWCGLLNKKRIDIGANFFDIGGNSLMAVRLANEIKDTFKVSVPLAALFQRGSIRQLSELIESERHASRPEPRQDATAVLLAQSQATEKLYLIHPVGGNVMCYRPAALRLRQYQCYGIQFPAGEPGRFSDFNHLAAHHCQVIERLHGDDPDKRTHVRLGGWSMGGVLALAVAALLEARHYTLAPLLLIDPWVSDGGSESRYTEEMAVRGFVSDLLGGVAAETLPRREEAETAALYLSRCLPAAGQHQRAPLPNRTSEPLEALFAVYYHNAKLLRHHIPVSIDTPIFLAEALHDRREPFPGLEPLAAHLARGRLNLNIAANRKTAASHWEIMSAQNLEAITAQWLALLEPGPDSLR